MNQLVRISPAMTLPALYASDDRVARRTLEFFTVTIRNPNTRRAYGRAAVDFAGWCQAHGISDLQAIQPMHVAAYIEALPMAAPSIKLHLAALRMLFDWLVVGQVLPSNPATSVRGPRHSVKKGKTPVLAADEARALLDVTDTSTLVPAGAGIGPSFTGSWISSARVKCWWSAARPVVAFAAARLDHHGASGAGGRGIPQLDRSDLHHDRGRTHDDADGWCVC